MWEQTSEAFYAQAVLSIFNRETLETDLALKFISVFHA